MPATYKDWLGVNRRERLLRKAKSKELKNAVDYLYRPNSIIGDGSTASVLKFEKTTGLGLGKNGNTHLEKARGYLKHLNQLLNDATLRKSDIKLVKYLRTKLLKALGGSKK